ncbi:MAG TPA: M48 family metalloprotease [Steroidobacteraceae bacterium]|nr:M48 family metalloprotease [Steroidobacteraceae bacterium]
MKRTILATALLLSLGLSGIASAATYLEEIKARPAAKPAPDKDKGKKKDPAAQEKPAEPPRPAHLAGSRNAEVPAAIAFYLDANARLVDNPELDAYLAALSGELLAPWGDPRPALQIIVQSSPAYYAEANDGDLVIIDSGLLRQSDGEAEIAAVLAHELAHVVLGHLRARSNRQSLIGSAELGGVIAATVQSKQDGVNAGNAPLKGDAKTISDSTFAVSTLTRDLLAPSWNRDQEREADKLAADLLKGAGFDHAALSRVFSRLAAAEAARSERLQRLHDQLAARFEQEKAQPADGDWKQVGENTLATMKQQVSTSVIDSIAARNVDHDTPEQRQANLAAYLQAAYPERKAKVARESAFEATLKQGPAHAALESAATADEAFALLARRDVRGAEALLKDIAAGTGRAQPSVALARGHVFSARNRKDDAIREFQTSVESRLAPAEAYAALAEALGHSRRHDEAIAALELGGKRIGRWATFLPDIVGVYKEAGNTQLAESSTLKCADEDRAAAGLGDVANLVASGPGLGSKLTPNIAPSLAPALAPSAPADSAPAPVQNTGPTYRACVARLGYDPMTKQAQGGPAQTPLQDATKKLADLFKKKDKKTN